MYPTHLYCHFGDHVTNNVIIVIKNELKLFSSLQLKLKLVRTRWMLIVGTTKNLDEKQNDKIKLMAENIV